MSSNHRRLQGLVDAVHGSMESRIQNTQKYFRDEAIPDSKKAPEQVQLQNFLAMKDSPEAWAALIQQKGVRSAIKYNEFGQRLYRKVLTRALKATGGDASAIPEQKVNPALIQALLQQVQQMQANMQQPMQPMVPAPEE